MTASDQQRYYFDIEDASKASGSTTSDDPFGRTMKLSTRAADDGRVTAVNAVTVRPSNRQYDDEIEVSMTIDTREGEYTTEFFIGDAATLDAAG